MSGWQTCEKKKEGLEAFQTLWRRWFFPQTHHRDTQRLIMNYLSLATLPCLPEQCNRCYKNLSRKSSLSKQMLVVRRASRPSKTDTWPSWRHAKDSALPSDISMFIQYHPIQKLTISQTQESPRNHWFLSKYVLPWLYREGDWIRHGKQAGLSQHVAHSAGNPLHDQLSAKTLWTASIKK